MKSFFVFAFILILFTPKIILIPLGTTGIRIEDFIAFVLFVIAIADFVERRSLLTSCVLLSYIFFISVNFVSSIVNILDGRVEALQSFLFTARLVEYLSFYYLGIKLYESNFNFSYFFKCYIVFLLVIYLLQITGLLNSFNEFSVSRFSGNTNGPYELALLTAVIFFFFIKNNNKYFACITFAILLLTASRITIGIVFLVFLYNYVPYKKINKNYIYLMPIFLLLLMAFLVFSSGEEGLYLIERVAQTFSAETYESLADIYTNAGSVTTQAEYKAATYGSSMSEILSMNGDGSSLIRFHRWLVLIKTTFDSYFTTTIGLGPSFAGVAVDGYYVRVFIETGMIGLVSFLFFLTITYKKQEINLARYIILIMAATGFFIDIFVALKPMFIFWVMIGYYMSNQVDNNFNRSSY